MEYLSEYEQKVLAHLLDKEKATIRELIRELGMNPATLIRAVDSLVSRDLAVSKRETTFPFRRYISPTEKGKAVASKLKELCGILTERGGEAVEK